MGLLIQAALPPASVAREVVGVGLAVGDGGSPSMIVTFGQAFRAGDVPAGAGMSLRLADGRDLPVQLDVTTRHPDGSAKFATVTAQLPALAEGEMRGMLQLAAPAAAPALDLAGLLAQHSAVIRIDPQDGGPAWSADLSALLSDALRRGAASVWSNGPLVAQARISLDVPEAVVGGAASMRVVTDLTVRADGTLAADVWLRNDVAMQAGGGTARYGVTVTLDGVEALRADHVKQAQYQAWGRLLDTSGGGAPTVRQDAKYLADAGAVARYDTAAGVDEGLLGSYGAAVVDAGWNTLLGSRGIAQYMPQTGGRADIGPATQAQAAWLISGDARAAAYAVGQAEASGSVPWNLWDEAAPSAGGAGTWLSLRDWPELWIDQRGGPSPGGLTQPIPGNTGWTPDTAHQPDLAFTPYLLTGRRALLDQVEAQAAWNLVADWPLLRDGKGIVANSLQVRGSAWALRQVDEAAWAAPDGSVEANYFRSMSEANWSWLRSKLPEWTAQQGEAHGWIPVSYDFGGDLRPWQQDYFATTAAAAARHGNADALAVLEWQANFLVGRFTHAAQGFDPHDGAAYLIWVGAGAETNTTWAEIGADTLALGLSNQGGWDKSQGDYPQLALESLALVADMLHSDTARSAYAWLKGAGAPFTTTRDYARDPIFNITYDATPTLPKNTNPVLLWQNTDGTPVGWPTEWVSATTTTFPDSANFGPSWLHTASNSIAVPSAASFLDGIAPNFSSGTSAIGQFGAQPNLDGILTEVPGQLSMPELGHSGYDTLSVALSVGQGATTFGSASLTTSSPQQPAFDPIKLSDWIG